MKNDLRRWMRVVEGYTVLAEAEVPRPVKLDGSQYPKELPDAQAIARYAVSVDDAWSEEAIADQFFDCTATLQLVAASQLRPDVHADRSVAKERNYGRMHPKTMPPLIVCNGEIWDGNHRFRIGLAKGQNAFWCYVIAGAGNRDEEDPDD